jgi:DNA polymerase alpha subunit B
MDSATLRGQLSEFFGDVVESDEKLCEECASDFVFSSMILFHDQTLGVNMCRMFNISAEDLFYKWEAFKFDGSGVRSFSSLTMESADALRSQIQRGLANKSLQTKHPLPGNMCGLDAKFLGSNVGRADTIKTEGTPIQFLSRLGRSGIILRYMYQKTSERSEGISGFLLLCNSQHLFLALDDHIDEIAEIVRDHYKISELGDPASTTEVGRVYSFSNPELSLFFTTRMTLPLSEGLS